MVFEENPQAARNLELSCSSWWSLDSSAGPKYIQMYSIPCRSDVFLMSFGAVYLGQTWWVPSKKQHKRWMVCAKSTNNWCFGAAAFDFGASTGFGQGEVPLHAEEESRRRGVGGWRDSWDSWVMMIGGFTKKNWLVFSNLLPWKISLADS